MNEVVVTGIGLATPLALGREQTWQALLEGQSAVRKDAATPGLCTARIDGLPVPSEARVLAMAFLAAAEALQDSGLDLSTCDTARFGCTVSCSKPDLAARQRVPESFFTSSTGSQMCRVFNLRGPLRNITAACATGAGSVAIAADWLRHGLCDMVLAGSVESSLHPLYLSAFQRMGVLCKEAPRPFDKGRDGFAAGEGAALLVLETKERALLRGAPVYGAVAGCSLASDAYHAVAFTDSGGTIAAAIRQALDKSRLSTVDYIHAHGTATPLNDIIETRAIKKAFGKNAARAAISSTKAATGHLLGVSGSLGIALCLMALRDNAVPPTLNLATPDPECDLDFVPQVMRPQIVDSALSLSFGFGGQIGAVVVTK
jgi:3-oxoacyl-[acyl-carrier-protein] synthase II